MRTKKDPRELFEGLMDKYERWVIALALSILHDFHAAEDVAQEAFWRLWKGIRTNRVREECRAWLRKVTVNLCKDHLGQPRTRKHSVLDEKLMETLSGKLDTGVGGHDIYRRICVEIETLPTQQRLAFSLVAFEGIDYRQIGEILDCSPATARKHCQLAREKLRRAVRRERSGT